MLRVIEQQKGPWTYSHDLTAMTEHATLLLDNIIQKYQRSTGPQHMRGCYTSHRWRRILGHVAEPWSSLSIHLVWLTSF